MLVNLVGSENESDEHTGLHLGIVTVAGAVSGMLQSATAHTIETRMLLVRS